MIFAEFPHEFPGEISYARCFVRILKDPEDPHKLAVIFAQGDYHGTSAENYAEQAISSIDKKLKNAFRLETNNALWIMHWIAKASITGKRRYINFEIDTFSTGREGLTDVSIEGWRAFSLEELSQEFGYSETELAIPDENLDAISFSRIKPRLVRRRQEYTESPKKFQAVRRFLARLVSLSLPRLGKFKFFRS